MAFTAKSESGQPEWKLIYDRLISLKVGDVITYDELEVALGRDLRDNRGPMYRANRELGKVNSRTTEPVANVGYRIVAANEHVRLATGRRKRAHKQLKRGLEVTRATNRGELTQQERERLDAMEERLALQEQFTRAHSKEIEAMKKRLDNVEASTVKRKKADEEERANALVIAEMRAAMEKAGLLEAPDKSVRPRRRRDEGTAA